MAETIHGNIDTIQYVRPNKFIFNIGFGLMRRIRPTYLVTRENKGKQMAIISTDTDEGTIVMYMYLFYFPL